VLHWHPLSAQLRILQQHIRQVQQQQVAQLLKKLLSSLLEPLGEAGQLLGATNP
jgi:hypothetical protein